MYTFTALEGSGSTFTQSGNLEKTLEHGSPGSLAKTLIAS